jgi:hypothetical protein
MSPMAQRRASGADSAVAGGELGGVGVFAAAASAAASRGSIVTPDEVVDLVISDILIEVQTERTPYRRCCDATSCL